MKKKLLGAVLFSLALMTACQPAPAAAEEKKEMSCKDIADRAGDIQVMRQMGIPIGEVLKFFEKGSFWYKVTLHAYKAPRFDTGTYQERMIDEFRTEYRVACEERT